MAGLARLATAPSRHESVETVIDAVAAVTEFAGRRGDAVDASCDQTCMTTTLELQASNNWSQDWIDIT